MFESRLSEFATKNQLDAVVVQELVQIFNEALVEIGQAILKDVPAKSTTVQKTTKAVNKRYKNGQARWLRLLLKKKNLHWTIFRASTK